MGSLTSRLLSAAPCASARIAAALRSDSRASLFINSRSVLGCPHALLLTHIHFDPAGASGVLVERWPDLRVYVHEKGARHMADPERLVASARQIWGEEFDRLWGRVVCGPVRSR